MDLNGICAEIEHMRRQILRQRKETQDLQRAGISTSSTEELLGRMQRKVDGLCIERDRPIGEQRRKYPGTHKVINGPIRSSGASFQVGLVRRKRGKPAMD
jgi:hypothetical protein